MKGNTLISRIEMALGSLVSSWRRMKHFSEYVARGGLRDTTKLLPPRKRHCRGMPKFNHSVHILAGILVKGRIMLVGSTGNSLQMIMMLGLKN